MKHEDTIIGVMAIAFIGLPVVFAFSSIEGINIPFFFFVVKFIAVMLFLYYLWNGFLNTFLYRTLKEYALCNDGRVQIKNPNLSKLRLHIAGKTIQIRLSRGYMSLIILTLPLDGKSQSRFSLHARSWYDEAAESVDIDKDPKKEKKPYNVVENNIPKSEVRDSNFVFLLLLAGPAESLQILHHR